MPELTEEQQTDLTAAAVGLGRRAEAEADPARAAQLAAAARDLAEVLAQLASTPARRREGARSAVVQSLRQASAARASLK